MQQIPLAIETRPEPSLESFVPGANAMALAQLAALSPDGPPAAAAGEPHYVWGPSGSGKTHLLRAVAARWRQHGGPVAWFDAGTPLPWSARTSGMRRLLIVLDGCEALDADRQHAAFTLFVDAASAPVDASASAPPVDADASTTAGSPDALARACAIAAAGRLPPVDLPLRDDLRSRLGWGHVLALQPLSDADARDALRAAAHARGLRLSDEVLDHLLTRHARDLKHMVAQLDRLDDFALASRRAITLPMLRQALHGEALNREALNRQTLNDKMAAT